MTGHERHAPAAKAKSEAEVVGDILKRAENHLVYLKDKNGGQPSFAIAEQEEYMRAAEYLLTRLQ